MEREIKYFTANSSVIDAINLNCEIYKQFHFFNIRVGFDTMIRIKDLCFNHSVYPDLFLLAANVHTFDDYNINEHDVSIPIEVLSEYVLKMHLDFVKNDIPQIRQELINSLAMLENDKKERFCELFEKLISTIMIHTSEVNMRICAFQDHHISLRTMDPQPFLRQQRGISQRLNSLFRLILINYSIIYFYDLSKYSPVISHFLSFQKKIENQHRIKNIVWDKMIHANSQAIKQVAI